MSATPLKYEPISCDFHDLLEALATTRKPAQIRYHDGDGTAQLRNATVTDLFSRKGAEYVVLSTGETLRLDQLAAIDAARLADY